MNVKDIGFLNFSEANEKHTFLDLSFMERIPPDLSANMEFAAESNLFNERTDYTSDMSTNSSISKHGDDSNQVDAPSKSYSNSKSSSNVAMKTKKAVSKLPNTKSLDLHSNKVCLSVISIESPNLSMSLKTSKRERRFVCTSEGCGKSFAKKWNLNAHERLHTGNKPFACRLGCGEHYMWMSSLKSHERRKCRLLPDSLRFRRKPRSKRSISVPNSNSKKKRLLIQATISATEDLEKLKSSGKVIAEESLASSEEQIVAELESILRKE